VGIAVYGTVGVAVATYVLDGFANLDPARRGSGRV